MEEEHNQMKEDVAMLKEEVKMLKEKLGIVEDSKQNNDIKNVTDTNVTKS